MSTSQKPAADEMGFKGVIPFKLRPEKEINTSLGSAQAQLHIHEHRQPTQPMASSANSGSPSSHEDRRPADTLGMDSEQNEDLFLNIKWRGIARRTTRSKDTHRPNASRTRHLQAPPAARAHPPHERARNRSPAQSIPARPAITRTRNKE
ncbi:hypothetical protein HBI47_207580 [Parastagonospora nodorum]|nr:hypothetical protein HBI47_207580 [Parastagonospora nodorum]